MDPQLLSWILKTTKDFAAFTKANYEPWEDMLEDDIAMYLITSVRDGTIIPIYVRENVVAFYEYWRVTPKYLKLLRTIKGNDDWINYLPSQEDRDGDGSIIFFPLAVVDKAYRPYTGTLTNMCVDLLRKDYPDLKGHYRWVLKEERLKYVPYRDKKKEE